MNKNKYLQKKQEKNLFFKKRQTLRRALMLTTLEKINDKQGKISTVELYHHVFNKGYAYSLKTLEEDLRALEIKKIVIKNVQYQGRGYGTKSYWKVKK